MSLFRFHCPLCGKDIDPDDHKTDPKGTPLCHCGTRGVKKPKQ